MKSLLPGPSGPLADIRALLTAVRRLRSEAVTDAQRVLATWQPWMQRADFSAGGRNLALYLAMRRHDLRPLQRNLMRFGLSSLGRSEARVEPTLAALEAMLGLACHDDASDAAPFPTEDRFFHGERRIASEAERLFGPGNNGRDTRIMVTLPSEAADDMALLEGLLRAGAECVRINCAHDGPEVWRAMVANLRRAEAVVGDGRRTIVQMDLGGPKIRTIRPPDRPKRRVFRGDGLLLAALPGAEDAAGPPCLGCTLPAVLEQVAVGDPVWIDDGQIGARVIQASDKGLLLEVFHAPPGGKKLRGDKGLNLPETEFTVDALTDKDLADLPVVLELADLVGYSFVQSAQDVAQLQAAIAGLLPTDHPAPGLVLKIETRRAVRHLPEIIVRAAGRQPTAVMIARGDLAVELGFERMAEMQEELLWLCEAAQVPVVWATQVLEKMTKEGRPSRAEVSDAAMADRADCVMLNKGPFVVEAVRLLDDVLLRMQAHQDRKSAQLRALHSWQEIFVPAPGETVNRRT